MTAPNTIATQYTARDALMYTSVSISSICLKWNPKHAGSPQNLNIIFHSQKRQLMLTRGQQGECLKCQCPPALCPNTAPPQACFVMGHQTYTQAGITFGTQLQISLSATPTLRPHICICAYTVQVGPCNHGNGAAAQGWATLSATIRGEAA